MVQLEYAAPLYQIASHWLQAHFYVHLFCEMDCEMVERRACFNDLWPFAFLPKNWHDLRLEAMGSYVGIGKFSPKRSVFGSGAQISHRGFGLIYLDISSSLRLGVESTLHIQ